MKYLLDANIFIQAKNFYPFDLFPSFWQFLIDKHDTGEIYSISEIRKELSAYAGKDELKTWCQDTVGCRVFFLPVDDEETQLVYSEMANKVNELDYSQPVVAEFLRGADLWLIAKAKTLSYTLVTEEKPQPLSKRKVRIPDICNMYNVPYINTINLIRDLGGQF